jgi:CHASE2 domain-containing sensor protein
MRKYLIDCLIATIFVFAVLGGIVQISQLNLFNAFDPLGKALGDMEMTDIAFSQIREDPQIDTNIVIVNIGNLNRAQIGKQIMNLSRCKPKVIGLDILFTCDWLKDTTLCPQIKDTVSNQIFANAVASTKNMVLGLKILQTDSLIEKMGDVAVYDSVLHTFDPLRRGAYEGFVNVITIADHQEDLKACRSLNPRLKLVDGTEELAFSVRMAMLYDSIKTKKFLNRGNDEEIINYRGNIVDWHGASTYPGRYPVLDWEQALDTAQFVQGMIKDKIVIMGFLGKDLRDTSWDDKFFTPLNKIYAGRGRPDMYGIVVHANVVSMILNEDYVDQIPYWEYFQYVFAFFVVFLNVVLFFWINTRLPVWFDTLSLLIQLAQVLMFSFLMIELFDKISFKLNLTVTLAGVALVGTCFELYGSVFKMIGRKIRDRLFTKKEIGELTP